MPENWVQVELLETAGLTHQYMVQYANLNATIFYNQVGSWTCVIPYTDALWSYIMAGEFVIEVNWRGMFTFGGKCEQAMYSDSIPNSTSGSNSAGGGMFGPFISLSGSDYLAILANRICYPDPTKAWASQTATSKDTVTSVPLETAIKHFVNMNVGPGALASRRHPLLTIAADQGRGPKVTYTVKFGTSNSLNLMDVVRALIAQGGQHMGVTIGYNANSTGLVFDCYVPADKTATAWFSESLGNLMSVDFALTDPTCTDALAQGASPMLLPNGNPDPAGNPFVQVSGTGITPWNKVEQYIDSTSETDKDNLQTSAADAIFTGQQGPVLDSSAIDTPYLIYGRDYHLGDKVSVEVRDGDIYQDIISSVVFVADPNQVPIMSTVPVIGNPSDAQSTDKNVINQLLARIRNLEKKLATKGKI